MLEELNRQEDKKERVGSVAERMCCRVTYHIIRCFRVTPALHFERQRRDGQKPTRQKEPSKDIH